MSDSPETPSRNRGAHFAAGTGSEEVHPLTGESFSFSPEEIEKYRAAERLMNPQAAAIYSARTKGFGAGSEIKVSDGLDTSIDAPIPSFGDAKAQADAANTSRDIAESGEISAGEGSASTAFSDEESGRGRRFPGAGAALFADESPGFRESPMSRIKESGDLARIQHLAAGKLLLREAGRCNAPSCQLARAVGIQLTGQTKRAFGAGVKSPIPAIPATYTLAKEYQKDPVTGKDMRKVPPTIIPVGKPADPKSPEWLAVKNDLDTSESNIFYPEDMLEHNHYDEAQDLAVMQERVKGLLAHLGEYNE